MEDDLPDTTVHIQPPFIANPRQFGQAGLFIDSASTPASSSHGQSVSTPNVVSSPNVVSTPNP